MPASVACLHRGDQSLRIERRQTDAVDSLRDEVLDHPDLLLAVVFQQRPLPQDLARRKLLGGLIGAVVHRLPELVRGPFRDHGDPQFSARIVRC